MEEGRDRWRLRDFYSIAQAGLELSAVILHSLCRHAYCSPCEMPCCPVIVRMGSVSSGSDLSSFVSTSGCIRVRWTVALTVIVVSWSHLITKKRRLSANVTRASC